MLLNRQALYNFMKQRTLWQIKAPVVHARSIETSAPVKKQMNPFKVLIIGAGAAGLCAAKHIASSGKFVCEVIEQTDMIGGTWVYTDEVYKNKYGIPIHSSMYKNLRTNIPVEIMPFVDFPFHPTQNSFIHHSDVLQYIKKYAEHNELYKHIEFCKIVENIHPVSTGTQTQWKVSIKDTNMKNAEDRIYDAVMVCNGHYSKPYIPSLPGINNFKGTVMHSHDYREPGVFYGKKVLIWGGSLSGFDIAQEVSSKAENVVLSHRMKKYIPQGFSDNVKLVPNVVSAFEDGFLLEDGSVFKANSIIYCTGYLYDFPFLTKDCKIEVKNNRVTPLYKHMVNIEYPTMCFVGLLNLTIPFLLFDYQVQFFLKILDKSMKLPSKLEMMAESEEENEKRCRHNIPEKYAHTLDTLQWKYFDDLANLANLEKPHVVKRNILEDCIESMRSNITDYKNYKYEIVDQENFKKSSS